MSRYLERLGIDTPKLPQSARVSALRDPADVLFDAQQPIFGVDPRLLIDAAGSQRRLDQLAVAHPEVAAIERGLHEYRLRVLHAPRNFRGGAATLAKEPGELSFIESLPPLLRPPVVLVDSSRDSEILYHTNTAEISRYSDQAYYFGIGRLAPEIIFLQSAIQFALRELNGNRPVITVGGKPREYEYPRQLGEEALIPYLKVHAVTLLKPRVAEDQLSTREAAREDLARGTLAVTFENTRNYDVYTEFTQSQWDILRDWLAEKIISYFEANTVLHVVDPEPDPILDKFAKSKRKDILVEKAGDDYMIRIINSQFIYQWYAPYTVSGFVGEGASYRWSQMSLYPHDPIAEYQIRISRFQPKSNQLEVNPGYELTEVRCVAVDAAGNHLDTNIVFEISSWEISRRSFDHRAQHVNFRQRRQLELYPFYPSVPHYTDPKFPEFDGLDPEIPQEINFAYCTMLRMCAEVLTKVFYTPGDDLEAKIVPLAHVIKPHTDRLMEIIERSGSRLLPGKVAEGLRQLIKFSLYPHAWATLADELDLGRIFPNAREMIREVRKYGLRADGEVLSDNELRIQVLAPLFLIDGSTYRMGQETAIHQLTAMVRRRGIAQVSSRNSPLAQYAQIFQPIQSQ